MREALRVQTRGVHEQLHHHTHFVALFDQAISLPQYRALLGLFHGFYAPLEDAIGRVMAQAPDAHGGFVYTPRAALLAQDLGDLGFDDADVRAAPQCTALYDVITPASLGGVLYVIEGSTLGANQIDRAAQKLLGADTVAGRRFWAWSRAHNKQRWAMTNAYLAHLDARDVLPDTVVAGAHDTFQALADWLAPLNTPIIAPQGAPA